MNIFMYKSKMANYGGHKLIFLGYFDSPIPHAYRPTKYAVLLDQCELTLKWFDEYWINANVIIESTSICSQSLIIDCKTAIKELRQRIKKVKMITNDFYVHKKLSLTLQVAQNFLEKALNNHAAAKRIQQHWRVCISNPAYEICRRRLLREYKELSYEIKEESTP